MTDAVNEGEKVHFKLVGAETYNTLTKGYKHGIVYACPTTEYQQRLVAASTPTGEPMFELTNEPATPLDAVRTGKGITIHDNTPVEELSDAAMAGLGDGTIDTGADMGNEDEDGPGPNDLTAAELSDAGDRATVLKGPKVILRKGPRNAELKAALPAASAPAAPTGDDTVEV